MSSVFVRIFLLPISPDSAIFQDREGSVALCENQTTMKNHITIPALSFTVTSRKGKPVRINAPAFRVRKLDRVA
jgi:hypothetical protein